MLSNKGKYGLKALMHLARLPPGTRAQSAEIALANDMPKKFLDSVLAELRVSGFVRAQKGAGGGYQLAVPARGISVGAVIRALDGALVPIACARVPGGQACADCPAHRACAIRISMLEVAHALGALLDGRTIGDLIEQSNRLAGTPLYDI